MRTFICLFSFYFNSLLAVIAKDIPELKIALNETIDLACSEKPNKIAMLVWKISTPTTSPETACSFSAWGKEYFDKTFIEKIESKDTYDVIYRSRIKRMNETWIRLRNTKLTDSAKWTCYMMIFENGQLINKELNSYSLSVISSPTNIDVTPTLDFVSGGRISIHCESHALSPFNLTWSKVNGDLPHDVSFRDNHRHVRKGSGNVQFVQRRWMNLEKATLGTEGEYQCEASNIAGSIVTSVLVKMKKKPVIVNTPTTYQINMYDQGKLRCQAKGYPPPDFQWQVPGEEDSLKPKDLTSRYEVLETTGEEEKVSVLKIKQLQYTDHAFFTCTVSNELGNHHVRIKVSGATVPDAPIILAADTTTSSVHLRWEFQGDGGQDILTVKLEYKNRTGSVWKDLEINDAVTDYMVDNLLPHVDYQFRVAVSNRIGMGEYSRVVTKKTVASPLTATDDLMIGNLGLTLIGIFGGILLALLCGAVCVCVLLKRMRKGGSHRSSRPSFADGSMGAFPVHASTVEMELLHRPAIDEWEFPRDRLTIMDVLGSGAFGVVMSGMAQGINRSDCEVKVAVKTVRDNTNGMAKNDLMAELSLLKLIPTHENVIGLLGCCTRSDPLYVIVEFCSHGDLQGFLRNSRGIYERYYKMSYGGGVQLTSQNLLSFAWQIARGMTQLATMKVIHRDLAARNILVDKNLVCKVSDFGFARDVYEEDHYVKKSAGGRFPIKWMAIESLLDGISTTKSDIWAYGVVLWELVTLGASPYPGMNSYEVVSFLQDGYRMDKPKHCHNEIYAIMMECWNGAPARRPSFNELAEKFNDLVLRSDIQDFINMNFYQDHLYVNFDLSSSANSNSCSNSINRVNSSGSIERNRINSVNSRLISPSSKSLGKISTNDTIAANKRRQLLENAPNLNDESGLAERSNTGQSVSNASERAALLTNATKSPR